MEKEKTLGGQGKTTRRTIRKQSSPMCMIQALREHGHSNHCTVPETWKETPRPPV